MSGRLALRGVAAALLVLVALGTLICVRSEHVFTRIPVTERVVALTFDDGPDPSFTPAILDELAARGVPATFFVVGESAQRNPDILRRIVASGHELGNHTLSHPRTERLDANSVLDEIAGCDAAVYDLAGVTMRWYRPPRGMVLISQEGLIVADGKGIAGWSHCLEAGEDNDSVALAEALEPGDIILMHDGRIGRDSSVAALPAFLDAAEALGFRFVTLSELDLLRTGPLTVRLFGRHR